MRIYDWTKQHDLFCSSAVDLMGYAKTMEEAWDTCVNPALYANAISVLLVEGKVDLDLQFFDDFAALVLSTFPDKIEQTKLDWLAEAHGTIKRCLYIIGAISEQLDDNGKIELCQMIRDAVGTNPFEGS